MHAFLPLFLALAAVAADAAAAPRCGTASLTPEIVRGLLSGSIAEGFASQRAALRNTAAGSPLTASSEHFTIAWLPPGTSSRDTISSAMNGILPGDSVPEAIRLSLETLEHARRLYVDTMGMAPPRAYSPSPHWGIASTGNRYLVEMLTVDGTNFRDVGLSSNMVYYAITIPEDDSGSSNIAVASGWTSGGLGGWKLLPDTASGEASVLRRDYRTDWRAGLAATLTHELFHAVQFNYERDLSHFFFEASAVGMEERGAPWTMDWPQYAEAIYDNLPTLTSMNEWSFPYGEGLWTQSLTQDCGDAFQKQFWDDRKVHGGDVLATFRRTSSGCVTSFEGLFSRHAMRLLGSGRRTSWAFGAPFGTAFSPFRLAAVMPSLAHDALPPSDSIAGSILSIPGLSPRYRSLPAQGGLSVLISGTGASIRLLEAGSDGLSQDPDFLLLAPSATSRWAGLANSDSGTQATWLGFGKAPPLDSMPSGKARSWTLADAILEGKVREAGAFRTWGCRDCWVPSRDDNQFLNMDSSHVFRFFDFSRSLVLDSASIVFPNAKYVYQRVNGTWTKLSGRVQGNDLRIEASSMDLRTPLTFRVGLSLGNRAKASVGAPYPNPARSNHPVRFPIGIWSSDLSLSIFASDGSLVATFHPQVEDAAAEWDLRTKNGRLVRPGVYFYHWSAAQGAKDGRIVVAP
jgi:hypothetical protein